MCVGHVLHVFVDIDALGAETTVTEAVHHVVVEPFHINQLVSGSRRHAVSKPLEHQMVAEERQVVGA